MVQLNIIIKIFRDIWTFVISTYICTQKHIHIYITILHLVTYFLGPLDTVNLWWVHGHPYARYMENWIHGKQVSLCASCYPQANEKKNHIICIRCVMMDCCYSWSSFIIYVQDVRCQWLGTLSCIHRLPYSPF